MKDAAHSIELYSIIGKNFVVDFCHPFLGVHLVGCKNAVCLCNLIH